jgi:hypothetical protein
MKRLAVALSTLALSLAACDNKTATKLEGQAKGGGTTGGANNAGGGEELAQIEGLVKSIDDRLKALETAHKITPGGDASFADRVSKIEANLVKREEALAFLEMAYAQQKRQEDAKAAGEHDPNAVFAVDISAAVAAGQVEGPNSAIVTIVEAWDFA